MRTGGVHLTYCSNIHAGETWPEVDASLRAALPRVRAELGAQGPFASGLRLSAAAARALAAPDALAAFRKFLAAGAFYVPTINGFPYGAFHGQRVKERVYEPDWRTPDRVAYANQLADLLAVLLADAGLAHGTVSTVPGGFRATTRREDDQVEVALGFLRHAAHLAALEARTGVLVTVAIEPEPACLIETVAEAVAFIDSWICRPQLIARASAETGVALTEAAVRRYVGLCLDACHMAVEFEDPAEAVRQVTGAGLAVRKVQVSAALQLDAHTPEALSAALAPFTEDTYLHQVVERGAGGLKRFVDLPEGLAHAAADSTGAPRDWRVHFHVPIFLAQLGGFTTTQTYLAEAIRAARAGSGCDCFEVETYTWDVLPPALRTLDLHTAIARELAWAREVLPA